MPQAGRFFPEMLIAFAVIALLGLLLRWTFARSRSGPDAAWPTDDPDYGLLVPVAIVDTLGEALRMRSRLAEAGIKATTAYGADGRQRVLVFPAELPDARRVAGLTGPS